MAKIVLRRFNDRKSAQEFAKAVGSKVQRNDDPYFKYVVRLTNDEDDKKTAKAAQN